MTKRRDPYLILGISHDANAREVSAAFAHATRRLKKGATQYDSAELTWALHQIESGEANPQHSVDLWSVPAHDFDAVELDPSNVLPEPQPLSRTTAADHNEVEALEEDAVTAHTLKKVSQAAHQGLADLAVKPGPIWRPVPAPPCEATARSGPDASPKKGRRKLGVAAVIAGMVMLLLPVALHFSGFLSAGNDDVGDERVSAGQTDESVTEDDGGSLATPKPAERGTEPPEKPGDVSDGRAAVVDGEVITERALKERFDAVVSAPEVAGQLESERGEALEEELKAQILSRLILDRIVALGAEELGVDASEEEIAEREAEEADAAGGEEAFAEQLESQGVSQEQLEEELRTIVLLDGIEEELTGDLPEEDFEGDEEMGISPADMAVQEWLFGQLTAREVEVDEAYGVWNAEAGQVIPASQVN